MDRKEEYHDPDYAGTSENVKEEPPNLSGEERIEKIKRIIRREFSNELEVRENEVMLIDQRMSTSRRLLHRLRYALVSSYYREQKLQLGAEQLRDEVAAARDCDRSRGELSSLLRAGQRRLHPSVRKLLGSRTADLSEIFKTRQPRARARPDYSAMLQIRNYTIAADSTKSLRPERSPATPPTAPPAAPPATPPAPPSRPRKLPRHIEPKVENVLTLDEQTRNKVKHRYRIVIGNTSKYAPPASRADRSTHKWLLYVRDYRPPGPGSQPGSGAGDLGAVVKSVTARLHHSYAPHHTVTLHQPPFHVSRRGWGEFTARLQLNFALPDLNPPACVSHTLKLDRHHTGLQTLGAETIVDVWLYSSPEMLKHAYVDDNEPADRHTDPQIDTRTESLAVADLVPKQEPVDTNQDDSWMDFFSKDTTELDVDDMIIKPVKQEPDLMPEPDMESARTFCAGREEDAALFGSAGLCDELKQEPAGETGQEQSELKEERCERESAQKKRIMKYVEPATGKIYYLEMDSHLHLSAVQEIVINNSKATISPAKNGVRPPNRKRQESLLRPDVASSLRTEQFACPQLSADFRHIENDHCYLRRAAPPAPAAPPSSPPPVSPPPTPPAAPPATLAGHAALLALRTAVTRLPDVRTAVYYLLKHIPLVDPRAPDPGFQQYFPFVVDSDQRYWKLDFAKRRNMEWSRAKLVSRLLSARAGWSAWRTKQVLTFARLHGLHPARAADPGAEPGSQLELSTIKQLYRSSDINSLTLFDSEQYASEVTEINLVDSDEEIDVEGSVPVRGAVRGVSEGSEGLQPLPPDEEDRLRYLFIERVCADIGIELRNEDVGNGYSYSLSHAVLLSALRSFAEELLRAALAAARRGDALDTRWSSSRTVVSLEHVYQAAGGPGFDAASPGSASSGSGRLQLLCARALAALKKDTYTV